LNETSWEDAAAFSTIFYKLIGEKLSHWVSFKKAMLGLSNTIPRFSGAWSFYEWGEKVIIDES
jgi:hypothetical protein